MKEYSQSMEKTVDFNLCVGDELAKEKIETGIYPITILGEMSYEFLKEYGNFYVKLERDYLNESFYALEPNERLNAGTIMLPIDENNEYPDFRLLIASTEYYPNNAIYIGNNGKRYNVQEYQNKILQEIMMEKDQGRTL